MSASEQPRQGDLRGGGPIPGGDLSHRPFLLGEISYGQREEGDEGDAFLFTRLQKFLRGAVGEVVEVLHGYHRRDLLRLLEQVEADVGEPQVADLALLLHIGEGAERLGQGHPRVGQAASPVVHGPRMYTRSNRSSLRRLRSSSTSARNSSGRTWGCQDLSGPRVAPTLVAITRSSG